MLSLNFIILFVFTRRVLSDNKRLSGSLTLSKGFSPSEVDNFIISPHTMTIHSPFPDLETFPERFFPLTQIICKTGNVCNLKDKAFIFPVRADSFNWLKFSSEFTFEGTPPENV